MRDGGVMPAKLTSRIMHFEFLLKRMAAAVCAGDGEAAAACFAPAGVYHDGFYGAFEGRQEIARMVRDCFHRDARDFEWRLHDLISDGRMGYARYEFSYVSRLAGSEGRRAGFPGISLCHLEDGLIRRYSELFERAPVLVSLGFSDERVLKAVKRWAGAT
jgi:ketosteroid isomerase-like protein